MTLRVTTNDENDGRRCGCRISHVFAIIKRADIKVGNSLVLSSPYKSLNLGIRVEPQIVAIEHVEQTHHLINALSALRS